MLPINFDSNPAPRRTLELPREPASSIRWKIKLPAGGLPAGLQAALQTFFNQRTKSATLLLGYATCLFRQLVRNLYGGLHLRVDRIERMG